MILLTYVFTKLIYINILKYSKYILQYNVWYNEHIFLPATLTCQRNNYSFWKKTNIHQIWCTEKQETSQWGNLETYKMYLNVDGSLE